MTSTINILDINSGKVEAIFSTDLHIEAPNWAPEKDSLIVNGNGKLFRLPLANPELQEIDTGFANMLNNDHGISPDGKTLVISDRTRHGASCMYTVPATGGEPTVVTEVTPSYWHGWSPDGKTLTYTAKRTESYQIYTCAVDGSGEICLTEGFDHCDGPDYSADGQWIWFNGDKKGIVQLWRVRPNGTDLEQMTNDDRVNWFPHPSPDGQHICYLAYEGGTLGHPTNKQVQLRLMPTEGGTPTVLFDLFGGQGTINVPSWAPDSQRFAFVSYQL